MRCLVALTFLLLLGAPCLQAQQFLNLDFEQSTPAGQARGWFQGGQGYEVVVDSRVAYSGAKSLRIRRIGEGDFGVATSSFPVADAAGKRVRFSGFIKTEDLRDGWAGLWWRVDGDSGVLAFDNMQGRGPSGTTPWTEYVIELDVDAAARNINFGVLTPGRGTAWFDGLRVELDGRPYEQVVPQPFEPSDDELAWIRDHAIAFATPEPGAGFDDLAGLGEMIGDARIVALGEGTHGTSEFFKMKHRLTEYLVQEMGFTVFAIEASMPEARRVNAYVLRGEGDPRAALAGMYFWTWNTQEVLDLIEWMRRYNDSGRGRVEFWGFDLQFPQVAMDSVLAFLGRAEPAYADSARGAYDTIRRLYSEPAERGPGGNEEALQRWQIAAQRVLGHLEGRRVEYLEGRDPPEVEWAIQNARIVLQGAQAMRMGGPTRDASMARNVEWILEHTPPGTKVVLWAHNGHVSRARGSGTMGSYLSERHGDDLLAVGFAFHDGEYTAVGDRGLGTYGTAPSEPGSLEWALHRTGLARLMLDLRPAATVPEARWLGRQLDFRSIGAMAVDYAFYPTVVTDHFDVLVYFDRSSPSRLLTTVEPVPGR